MAQLLCRRISEGTTFFKVAVVDYARLLSIALITLLARRSSLAFCKEITAHTAAGIQPIIVIWRMRQRIPVSILPLNIKDNQGKRMATRVMLQWF